MLRVNNLHESISFYVGHFGMEVVRRIDKPNGKSIAFVGYGSESDHTVLELVQDDRVSETEHGNRFGHIAIEVADARSTFEALKIAGVKILRLPRVVQGTELIGSVEDPNGYKVELIQAIH